MTNIVVTGIVPVTMSILLAPILIKKTMTWADAQKYCKSAHFDLAMSKTENDLVMLRSILAKQNIRGIFWLGLYNDFDSWRWSQNDLPLKNITLRRWGSGDPNNMYGHESCGAIDQNGLWWDTVCTSTKTFICYDGE